MEFPSIFSSLSSSNAKLFFSSQTQCTEGKLKMVTARRRWFLRRSYKEELQISVIYLSWERTASLSKGSGNKTESFPPWHLGILFPVPLFPGSTVSNTMTSALKETLTHWRHMWREANAIPRPRDRRWRTTKARSNIGAHHISPLENIIFNMQTSHQEKRGLLL